MARLLKHTYHIDGMNCSECVSTVMQKLWAVAGVTSVTVNLGKDEAEVTLAQEIATDTLRLAISNTHYTIADLIEQKF